MSYETTLASLSKRLDNVEAELANNTQITTEVRDLLSAVKGGFKVLGWLGTGFKWVGGLMTAGLALWSAAYALFHNGQLPR